METEVGQRQMGGGHGYIREGCRIGGYRLLIISSLDDSISVEVRRCEEGRWHLRLPRSLTRIFSEALRGREPRGEPFIICIIR